MSRNLLLIVIAIVAAAGGFAARRSVVGPVAVAGPTGAAAPDGRAPRDTFRIAGPTVIAYFAVTQAEVDENGDILEALADFQHYLPRVERGLAACGVRFFETYDSPVFLARDDAVESFVPRALAVPVGYRSMRPGLPDTTFSGVHTDVDILDAAAEYFGLAEDCWHPRREPPAPSPSRRLPR